MANRASLNSECIILWETKLDDCPHQHQVIENISVKENKPVTNVVTK